VCKIPVVCASFYRKEMHFLFDRVNTLFG